METTPDDGHDDPVLPLDGADPRFPPGELAGHPRTLVASRGPGSTHDDPRARVLRIAVPLLAVAGLLAVIAVFSIALGTGSATVVVGSEAEVRAVVSKRPRLVCFNDNNPCAWLTVVDDRLLALNSNGTLPSEYGRQGIGWCERSGYFGSNTTGSRYDAAGKVVRGPAPRGLDLVEVMRDPAGRIVLDFRNLTTNGQARRNQQTIAPTGRDCDEIPFDREAFWLLG